MYNLSMCAIAKDETLFIKEWVEYHLSIGFEHFYIYDNGSKTPISETLKEQIDAQTCTVINFPGPSMQIPAYDHCLSNFGSSSKWIGFLDIDEFLALKQHDNAQTLLSNYEKYGALNINWRIFGSNGHITRPEGSVLENYTMATPDTFVENLHTKAIIRPIHTICTGSNPHHFRYKQGYYAVSENFDTVPNAWTKSFSAHLAQINHYTNRSLQDFEEKIAKGRADGVNLPTRDAASFKMFDDNCTVNDRTILTSNKLK